MLNNQENQQATNYDFNAPEYEYVQENMEESKPVNEIPWKQLSIGGAFGLLVGGGSIIAANNAKSNDEEALMVGAEAGDISLEGEDNNPEVVDTKTPESGTNQSVAAAAAEESASHADENISVYNDVAEHVQNHAEQPQVRNNEPVQARPHVEHNVEQNHYDVYEQVNVVDINDDMSFAEAFAQARAELGPGGAFEWRGGVFGTYLREEWNSMSHSEQQEFTATALNTSLHAHQDHYMAKVTVTHHFSEGDVIDLDTGLPYHDEPYYVDIYDINDMAAKSEYGDTDVYVDDSSNDIEIIDVINDMQDGVQELVDLNHSVGDFLSDVSQMLDHVESTEAEYGDIASLINAANEVYEEVQDVFDSSYDSSDTPDDIMPDYVSDGDTVDII